MDKIKDNIPTPSHHKTTAKALTWLGEYSYFFYSSSIPVSHNRNVTQTIGPGVQENWPGMLYQKKIRADVDSIEDTPVEVRITKNNLHKSMAQWGSYSTQNTRCIQIQKKQCRISEILRVEYICTHITNTQNDPLKKEW